MVEAPLFLEGLFVYKVCWFETYLYICGMELNSVEDVISAFPDELSARKWLASVRWGEWASCPHCGNAKAYFIEGGSRYKCANKNCYKKFSVTTKTILEATNIPLNKWLILFFIYIKKRGKPSCYDLEDAVNVGAATKMSSATTFLVTERVEYIWPKVDRIGKQIDVVMSEMFMQCVYNYDAYVEHKHSAFYKNKYHISELTDITDPKQYSILESYIKYYIIVFARKFIWNSTFAHPKEVMTEIFLYLKDNNIREYNVESILKITWRVINNMWGDWIKAHPNSYRSRRLKQKESKRRYRRNLTDSAVVEAVKNTKEGSKMSTQDIYRDKELIKKTRERIIAHRKKTGKLYDFNSHFS